jgi:hypothetical protein
MSSIIHNNKTYKTKYGSVDNDYLFFLEHNISKNIEIPKNLDKIDEIKIMPNFNNYDVLLKYNYNLKQLKQMAKEHKLKLSGNKTEILLRIYSYLYLSKIVVKVQKIIRGCLQRKYDNSHGPGFKNKSLCVNNFDFLSMDELTTISNEQFFSFKDKDGFIYGFDILSFYNLIYKSNGDVKNPFNQQPITSSIIENFRSLLRLSKILNVKIVTEITDITKEISDKKTIELRSVSLFQNINALGNYSDVQWFLTLNRQQLIKFVRELVDIWHYRANISINIKKAICYPSGNPFQQLPHYNILEITENLDDVRKIILDIMEKLVNSGIDNDNKCLGAFYVLSALTLVNYDAATSLPWLYEAAYHV